MNLPSNESVKKALSAFDLRKSLASILFCALMCAAVNKPTPLGIALLVVGCVCYVLATKSELSPKWRLRLHLVAVNAYLLGIGPANRLEWFSPFNAEKLLPILCSIVALNALLAISFFLQWRSQRRKEK